MQSSIQLTDLKGDQHVRIFPLRAYQIKSIKYSEGKSAEVSIPAFPTQ